MNNTLVKNFNQLLKVRGITIAFAESITAGMICSRIASVPGASSVLKGGIITYDEKLKTKFLHVSQSTLEKFTAESAETTLEMVKGLKELDFGASINVAITGVASVPTNEYKIKASVGDVFIAVDYNNKMFEKKVSLDGERNEVREKAIEVTLKFVMEIISE